MTKPSCHRSVPQVLHELHTRFGEIPYLACGQTVLWDEPTKAVWCRLLQDHAPASRLIAAVHDTDYFAKTTALVHSDQKYVMLPHDDGATRGLWSAAGEMSALFGSEDLPTRALYEHENVPFNKLAEEFPQGKAAFYAEQTSAWGWRGIVNTDPRPPIAHDVPAKEIAPALLLQMDWAFAESLASLAPEMRPPAQAACDKIRGWVTEYLAGCSEKCTLTDLYQELLPRLYALLLGEAPPNLSTSHTVEILRFNTQTASRARFAIVSVFLQNATRQLARDAYDQAVHGGGMYALSAFGEGAIPFDLVAPGHGRGTLRVTDREVVIAWPNGAAHLPAKARPQTSEELAHIIEAEYGKECALVGKAVTLIDMFAGEFVLVLHEGASGYTPRTHAMNQRLREAGVALNLKPILRLTYSTWDTLGEATGSFALPPYLAAAFASTDRSLPFGEFSARWRAVVDEQKARLEVLRTLRKPRDLMAYLEMAGQDSKCWQCFREKYDEAIQTLKSGVAESGVLRDKIDGERAEIAACKEERRRLEREMGDDYRARVRPLQEKLSRYEADDSSEEASNLRRRISEESERRIATFEARIVAFQERIHTARRRIRKLRAEKLAIERSDQAIAARLLMAKATYEAEMAKLALVRTALLVSEGLPHTQLRPTAWWLPLVDPSGAWFSAIAAGTQARLEEL